MNKNDFNFALDLIDFWQIIYPSIFPHKPFRKKPLAINIHNYLFPVSHFIMGASLNDVKNALSLWCNGKRYWKACSRPFCYRYGIYGILGHVTYNQAKNANEKLENLTK